jgi:hypothetical protein
MSELQPTTQSAAAGTDGDVYRPLSALAVAAFAVASAYAVLMTVFGAVALTTGNPLFLALWTVVIPISGAVLAYAARTHIRSAEGARGGMKLANWAWWLCLLFGAGFLAYYFGTFYAVSWQAKDFTKRWMDTVRDGKLNEAFLDTLPPNQRKHELQNVRRDSDYLHQRYGVSDSRRKGPLVQFEDSDPVRGLQESGAAGEVKFLGVKDWVFDKGGFSVAQSYRLTNFEGDTDFELVAQSSEGPELEGRQWQIVRESIRPVGMPKRTPLGQTLEDWRTQARKFASDWLKKKQEGDFIGAFLDTLPPSERAKRKVAATALAAAGLTARPDGGWENIWPLLPAAGQAMMLFPDFRDFLDAKLIKSENFQAPARLKADMIADITREFYRPAQSGLRIGESKGRVRMSEGGNGPTRILEPVEWAIFLSDPTGPGSAVPKFTIQAALVLETSSDPRSDQGDPVWRVAGIDLLRGATPPAMTQGPGAQ